MHFAARYGLAARQNAMSQWERASDANQLLRRRGGSALATSLFGDVPEALPCRRYDNLFADDADIWGNIVVKDETELQRWVKFCVPTSKEAAEAEGGCVIYRPRGAKTTKEEPQYFKLCAPDDTVYGRAVYLSHGAASTGETEKKAAGTETGSKAARLPEGAKVPCC